MKFIKLFFISSACGLLIALAYLTLSEKQQAWDQLTNLWKQSLNAQQIKQSFSKAVKVAAPSVVTIYTQRHQNTNTDNSQQLTRSNLGSGVIISENGIIITNNHVIDSADNILVHLSDGRSASAILIGQDKETDLAILKIPFRNLATATVRSGAELEVGEVVLAIGNPLNIGQTVTMGIVSATGRNRVGINTYENFIQTDASINPGNSGGALVDINGHLIGINTAIFSQSGGSQGIGFAIPMSLAINVMNQLIQNGHVSRGWFGVVGLESTLNLNNQSQKGVLISEVFENSPAHKAGIRKGDFLIQIHHQNIRNIRDVVDKVATFKPGSYVQIAIVRDEKIINIDLKITERPVQ